jgi:putative PIN family toxin of toxin-antitoxin system
MRVVIDTGVLISAAIKAQTVPSIAVHRAVRWDVVLKSDMTEAELREVIVRPYLARLIAPTAQVRLMDLMASAELVPVTERIAACRDPKDDKFLELAVNGEADLIMSGDADLLVLNPFRTIPIITPAAFVQRSSR